MTRNQGIRPEAIEDKTCLFWESTTREDGVWVVYFNEPGWQTKERENLIGTYARLGDAALALFEAWQTYHREAMERAQAAMLAARNLGSAL